MDQPPKKISPRNRGMILDAAALASYSGRFSRLDEALDRPGLDGLILQGSGGVLFCQDTCQVLPLLPQESFDLIIADPPYNMNKDFHGLKTARLGWTEYGAWLESWLLPLKSLLKPGGSLYVCADWLSSGPLQQLLEREFHVRNRITWEREKGRASSSNWKNSSEDIWFCTKGTDYHYDAQAVRLRRRVIAPYRQDGMARDWKESGEVRYRDTGASNLWSDITVPFWSMSENTPHPTQKPEKLVARLILASSRPGDLVLDPFCGSGTTAVCAAKLGRSWVGIEINPRYCAYALARVDRARQEPHIQGYEDGVFYERNFRVRARNASGDQGSS